MFYDKNEKKSFPALFRTWRDTRNELHLIYNKTKAAQYECLSQCLWTARNALRKQLQYIRQPARITEGQIKTQTEIWPLVTQENTSGVLSGSDSNRIAPWKDTGWNTKGREIHSDSIRIAVTKLVSEWLSGIQTNGKGTFITVFTKTLHCFQMIQKDFNELYYKPVMPSKSAYTSM